MLWQLLVNFDDDVYVKSCPLPDLYIRYVISRGISIKNFFYFIPSKFSNYSLILHINQDVDSLTLKTFDMISASGISRKKDNYKNYWYHYSCELYDQEKKIYWFEP